MGELSAAEVVYGDGASSPARSSGARRAQLAKVVALCCSWALVATWLQVMRGVRPLPIEVIWAEDGGVFLNQAMRHPLQEVLFAPHAGYLQVVGRLVAASVAELPIGWAAAGLALGAAVVVALISLLVWFRSGHIVRNTWARVLLTALVPLLPQAGYEVVASVANLHWYLGYAAFWVLLVPARSVRGHLGSALVVVLAALSDPLTGLVLPAALVGLLFTRRRLIALTVPVTMLAALCVQLAVRLSGAPSYRVSDTSFPELPQIYLVRVILSALTGDNYLEDVYVTIRLAGAVGIGLAVLIGLGLLWWKADRGAKFVSGCALACSVIYLCTPLVVRGTGGFLGYQDFSLNGSRYTIVPLLLLWTTVIVLIDNVARRSRDRPTGAPRHFSSLAGVAVAGFLGVQLLNGWAGSSLRSIEPSWQAGLAQAARECRGPPYAHEPQRPVLVGGYRDGHLVPIVPGPEEVTVPVPPLPGETAPLLFGVVIPCSALR